MVNRLNDTVRQESEYEHRSTNAFNQDNYHLPVFCWPATELAGRAGYGVQRVGQLNPPPPGPFDMVGLIQSATLTGPAGCVLCGGTLKINNIVITVPANTIVEMPATGLAWGELFSKNPTGNAAETGMAIADTQRLPVGGAPATYEAHVQGNIVNGEYIAGLIFFRSSR